MRLSRTTPISSTLRASRDGRRPTPSRSKFGPTCVMGCPARSYRFAATVRATRQRRGSSYCNSPTMRNGSGIGPGPGFRVTQPCPCLPISGPPPSTMSSGTSSKTGSGLGPRLGLTTRSVPELSSKVQQPRPWTCSLAPVSGIATEGRTSALTGRRRRTCSTATRSLTLTRSLRSSGARATIPAQFSSTLPSGLPSQPSSQRTSNRWRNSWPRLQPSSTLPPRSEGFPRRSTLPAARLRRTSRIGCGTSMLRPCSTAVGMARVSTSPRMGSRT